MYRVYLRSPATRAALAFSIMCGGVGAAYPRALLAAPTVPGVVAGCLLGIAGAGICSVFWGVPLAASISSGNDPAGPRACLHASGISQLAVRRSELIALFALSGTLALVGAAGGVASTIVQQVAKHRFDLGLAQAPKMWTLVVVFGLLLLFSAIGWALGVASRRAVVACAIYASAVAVTVLLAGASYFAPSFRFAAALSPLGVLLSQVRDQLGSRQFSGATSQLLRLTGAVGWLLLIVFSFARSVRNHVR